MKILFSSDWQASYDNLDLCSRAAQEILQLKGQFGFETLVLCGDLKHVYNPVDLRVINFWQRTIKKWIREGLEVVVDLGNHDRLGLHSERPNWMGVLRNVGAKAYDEPAYHSLRNGFRLAMLPYRQNQILAKREAHDIAIGARAATDVLIFHGDLKSARYSVVSRSAAEGVLEAADIYPRRFMYCVGGHLHFQQRVEGNIYYAGSPFATDWGEANQKKGYLLLDLEEKTLKRIRSKIPGWYDPLWPGFEEAKPEDWTGAHVRIKVPCDTSGHVAEEIRKATEKAEKTYSGAQLSVVPVFNEENRPDEFRIKSTYSDEKKIRIYVRDTLPAALNGHEGKVQEYLIEQLKQVGGLQREGGELRFRSVSAANFLSYKALNIKFAEGLTVVSGRNLDWLNRSNGSGKTSYLQPIAVALFGQTFKGQKHNGWMRRGTEANDKSYVKVWFKDSHGRDCTVYRGRQPNKLKLWVNGELVEGGNRPGDTQRLIEQITGYTWETLSNAVYVDQGRTHLMLTGTEAQRKGFLAKLQNLERFERAWKRIGEDKAQFEWRNQLLLSKIEGIDATIKSLNETIEAANKILETSSGIQEKYIEAREAYRGLKWQLDTWEAKADRITRATNKKIAALQRSMDYRLEQQVINTERAHDIGNRLVRFERLDGECPTCFQPVDAKLVDRHIKEWKLEGAKLLKEAKDYESTIIGLREEKAALEVYLDKWRRNQKLAIRVGDAKDKLLKAEERLQRHTREEKLVDDLRGRIRGFRTERVRLEGKRALVLRKLAIIKYAQTVFHRSGLPSFLNAQICPELNEHAREYAELFTQGEIQVRFAVDEEGRMDVQVLNAHGGQNVEDQSEGEMKLASLITAFAVRSLAPKTNILILDEPGDGLDSVSARGFAKGLREIAKKFCIINLTSHNPTILAELADSRLAEVTKRGGISEVAE